MGCKQTDVREARVSLWSLLCEDRSVRSRSEARQAPLSAVKVLALLLPVRHDKVGIWVVPRRAHCTSSLFFWG